MKKLHWLVFALIIFYVLPTTGQTVALSKAEKKEVLFMLEEEKLARDVYLAMYEKWGHHSFDHISASEERHLQSILVIAKENDLKIPSSITKNEKGKFNNKKLQSLYDELITDGNQSLIEALKVGAKVEEIDINDLEKALAQTENETLQQLFTRLRKASGNHLRAFTKNLAKQGVEYQPILLESGLYKSIIQSAEKEGCCSSGKGKAAHTDGNAKGEGCQGKSKAGKGKSCCQG